MLHTLEISSRTWRNTGTRGAYAMREGVISGRRRRIPLGGSHVRRWVPAAAVLHGHGISFLASTCAVPPMQAREALPVLSCHHQGAKKISGLPTSFEVGRL